MRECSGEGAKGKVEGVGVQVGIAVKAYLYFQKL